MHRYMDPWCSGILAEVPLSGRRRRTKVPLSPHSLPFAVRVIVKETPHCASAALRAHRLWSRDQRRTNMCAPDVALTPRPPPPTAPARSRNPRHHLRNNTRSERLTLLPHARTKGTLAPARITPQLPCGRRWRVAPTAASLPARPSWRGRRRGAAGSCRPLLCDDQ